MTKEITTKLGTKFVLKESITYGEHLDIKDVYLSQKDSIFISREADKKGFEFVVVSIDGLTTELYEKFKKLPYSDVEEILTMIKEAISPKA